LTGDTNPLHVDAVFAATTTFGKPVVQGILCTSLFPTIFGATFPGAIYVAQDVRFHKPIHVGDAVHAEIEVLQVKTRMRLVVCATRCLDHHGDVAISGEAKVLLPKLPPSA
jgi:acyl dehydratase